MRLVDADKIAKDYFLEMHSNYSDDYKKGFQAGLRTIFKYPEIELPKETESVQHGGEAEKKKTCNECVSRFLCPNNYRACDGYNDEGLFWGLVKLNFPLAEERIDKQRALIKSLQKENT